MPSDQKTRIPYVPLHDPPFAGPKGEGIQWSYAWIIFFERLGNWLDIINLLTHGDHVIGWNLQDCTNPGTDVSDPVMPVKSGNIAGCWIRIKVTDESNPLEIDIRNNGVSIFTTTPLIAAGTDTRDIQKFTDFSADPLYVESEDDLVIDIVQAGAWEVSVYLPYEEPESP